MRKIIVMVRACALIVYAFLLVMHFIVKDHFQILQVFFYAFPLPILIFLGSIITLLFYKPRRYFIVSICITLGLTGIWLNTSYNFSNNTEIPEDAISVLFWNAADGPQLPMEVLLERISIIKPDIIGLVEAKNASPENITLFSKTFPSYEFRILEGNMLVGINGHIEHVLYVAEKNSYHVNYIEAQLKYRTVSVAITDIFQDPTMDKKKAIGTVFQFISKNNTDIIVGDFNTPQESVHFKDFKADYTSFHDYGSGFTATWPFAIPLLELDQIFAHKTLTPILLQKFHYSDSDHAMLVAYMEE